MRIYALLFILLFCLFSGLSAQPVEQAGIRIDSVRIRKNWRTKERIILQEVDIKKGDILTTEQLERMISKIWNIGNFTKVSYQIDTLENNHILLLVTAQDAVTIMPDLSVKGNRKEYSVTAGVNDNNFLGRNIDLGIAGSFGTNAQSANVRLGIPRQLLYKNMTLRSGFSYGSAQRIKYEDKQALEGIAYMQKNFYFSAGNPWHTDYSYTFSPDLSIGYFSHKTDSTLLSMDIPSEENYTAQFLTLSLNESVGLINRIRHQEDGYQISAGAGYGLSLSDGIPGYFSAGAGARYARLFNRHLQFNASASVGYTSSELPSVINYLGPDNVKGIITGERWGRTIWSASTGIEVTYINRDWFAIEQSFYVNAGNAESAIPDLFRKSPLMSAGTSLRFMVPFIPWLAITFHYAWRGGSDHWYSMDL